jgi:hypothetical protein
MHPLARLDETPIATEIAVHCAGAPTVTVINDLGRSKLYTKTASVLFDAAENLFFGPSNIPIPQNLASLGLMRWGTTKRWPNSISPLAVSAISIR